MTISQIQISGVRNLSPTRLTLSPQINLLIGNNGSGKTSFLEAIHLLGLGRSFRTSANKPVISYNADQYTVFGDISTPQKNAIGVSRSRQGDLLMKLNAATVRTAASLAATLPLQLLNQDSFALLEGSPKQRRQFVDWGVFHVEHSFLAHWKRAQRALKQRNHALRHGMIDRRQLASWDVEFVAAAEQIDQLRAAYVAQLSATLEMILSQWDGADVIQLSYYRGWDKSRDLAQVLEQDYVRDQQMGFTQRGPHRADLRIRSQGLPAAEVLSRGQQKVVVSALKVAQGYLLARQQGKPNCVFLVDDLASELDERHRRALCSLLAELKCQVFVTGIDKSQLINHWSKAEALKVFHVEQGEITEQAL